MCAREHQLLYNKAIIIDALNAVRGARLRGWLERYAVATTLLRADGDGGVLLARHGVDATGVPVAVLYDGTVLVDPKDDDLAEALGANTHPTQDRYDVVIVGAGPAGLPTAVYAGAEGLESDRR